MPNPQEAQHYIEGVNFYVPDMQLHSHVGSDGFAKVELGTPVAANATGIVNAGSIATGSQISSFAGTYSKDAMGKYGRNVTAVLSGAGTPAITIRGRDYLGQAVTETLTGNGTTPVVGKKAFKYIDRVDYGVVAATTMNIGWGDVFGLPFKSNQLLQEAVNEQATASAGTFTAAVTATQTATTGDPRGTYAPHTANAPNGSRSFTLEVRCDKTNLHGARHFGS